jgi:hypothetical protein
MTRYKDTSPAQINSGDGPFSLADDNAMYRFYYAKLLSICTTRFRWLGLGDWIDPMRVEFLLVTQGLATFTFVRGKDTGLDGKELGEPAGNTVARTDYYSKSTIPGSMIFCDRFTITRAAVTGTLDDTFTPAGYRTYAPNGAGNKSFNTTGPLEEWEGVPIWGDINRSFYDQQTIALFARRLAQSAVIVDTNMKATTRGMVLFTDQDDLLSSRIALDSIYRGFDTAVAKGFDLNNIKAVDFGVHPDTVISSHQITMRIWAEALESLGVKSPADEKRERVVVDEVGRDESQIGAIRRAALTPRRQAAMLINRRFFSGQPIVEVIDQDD